MLNAASWVETVGGKKQRSSYLSIISNERQSNNPLANEKAFSQF